MRLGCASADSSWRHGQIPQELARTSHTAADRGCRGRFRGREAWGERPRQVGDRLATSMRWPMRAGDGPEGGSNVFWTHRSQRSGARGEAGASGSGQALPGEAEEVLIGTGGGHREVDAPHRQPDHGPDLQQAPPDAVGAGHRQPGAPQGLPQPPEQDHGEGRQVEAQGVGAEGLRLTRLYTLFGLLIFDSRRQIAYCRWICSNKQQDSACQMRSFRRCCVVLNPSCGSSVRPTTNSAT